MKRNPLSITILLTLCVALSACNSATPVPPTPSATLVPSTPTATEEPMALKVNDEGITMVEYQAELTRLQTSQSNLGTSATADEQRNRVIENFTDLLLLEQAAQKSGYTVDDATLKSRLDSLATSMGGADALSAWETTNGYTAETFQTALKREIYADYQRDQIINSVPETADQVHARQILVQDKVNADSLLAQLKAGKDFATLASTLDPIKSRSTQFL